MAKKEIQSSRGPTRRQVAMSRKEQEKLRLLYMGLGFVGLLIVIVLAFGLVQSYIIEPNTPIATVDGKEITTGDYQDRVLYERFILDDQLQRIIAQASTLPEGGEEGDQFTELLRNQLQQRANQIAQQRGLVDRQTLDLLILEVLIRDEADRRGITVTDDEVTEAINSLLAAREGGLTAGSAEKTSTARADASATAALWTPTPTFTPSPTLTTTQEITPTATPVDTPPPAPTPTFNVISSDTLATRYTEWINTLSEQVGIDEQQYRQYIRQSLLRNKLSDALAEEVPKVAEHAHARHILVETEEEANEVVERLGDGEEFAELATELSTDPGSAAEGGDLGFVPRGRFVPPVEEAIFSLPIGEVSEPIQSQFGWHIVEVLEREERELSPADYSRQQQAAFTEWVTVARETADVEDLWSPESAPPDPLQQFNPGN